MLEALLALAMLADPMWRGDPRTAHSIATEALATERRYGLPLGLVAAVVLVESGGRAIVSRRRRCGGRDYGLAQLHAHDPDRRRLAVLLALAANLDRAGQLLASSRERCSRRPRWRACQRSVWALYNAGAPSWWTRVRRAWSRLRTAIAVHSSS